MENDKSYHIFNIIYHLEQDIEVEGRRLDSGFYRYTYDLAGEDLSDPCEYSPDRREWSRCDMFGGLGEFQDFFQKVNPVPVRLEREDYVETIHYRGMSVPIFCDDYGQCFYCIFDSKVMSFGTFQTEYEDEVKGLIDHMLDFEKTRGAQRTT